MGTIKRLNDQQKQQAQAEAAMPGAYENRYDEGIQNALAGMDSANSAGLGYDSQNGTYRGALSRLFGNAGAGASAAEQVANSLSGGYGTDWAKSAAQQAAAGETGQTANVYAQARADALSQWRQELAGQGTQLDNLLTQDQLARSEYDGSVADAANWRNYRYGRTQQARQENSDFLNNVWNVIKNVGSDVGKAYDAYKGYSQQKMAMDAAGYQMAMEAFDSGDPERARQILKMYNLDETQVDSWTESYATKQSKANWSNSVIEQATAYQQAGYPELANQLMTDAGYDPGLLETWGGLTDVQKDQMAALLQGAELAAGGNDTAAHNYLQMAGLPTGSVDSYSTIANRLNQADLAKYASQLALQNRYRTTTGTGSGRRSGGTSRSTKSGSTSSKVDGYTQPQLNTMFKEYSTMKPDDQRRSYYEDTLADAGRIDRLSGVGNPGKANGTAWEQGMYNARKMANSGYSQNQIASELANNTSLSSDQISAIMNQIDYEWRGTK
jgi:hypothetical protein